MRTGPILLLLAVGSASVSIPAATLLSSALGVGTGRVLDSGLASLLPTLFDVPEDESDVDRVRKTAWGLQNAIRDHCWPAAAVTLLLHPFAANATVVPSPFTTAVVNEAVDGATALQQLLRDWHRTLSVGWPATASTQPHRILLAALLAVGADPIESLGTAVRHHNLLAMRTLLAHANSTLGPAATAAAVASVLLNGRGSLFHSAASTPTPATARMFFRAGQAGIGSNATAGGGEEAVLALADEFGVVFTPDLYPTALKRDLELASEPLELDVLSPFLPPILAPPVQSTNTTAAAEEEDDNSMDWEGDDDNEDGEAQVLNLLPLRESPPGTLDDVVARLATEWDGARDLTPSLVACANGREGTLRRLLALLPADTPFDSPFLLGGPGSHGATCATLAAAQGYVNILRLVVGRFGPGALLVRDALGHSPCALALLQGAVHGPAIRYLGEQGACPGVGAVELARASTTCPFGSGGGAHVPTFDPIAHVRGGWRMLSPSALRALSLPADLLVPGGEEMTASRNTSSSSSPFRPFRHACAVPELPPSVFLVDDPDALLLRDYMNANVPFVVRGAYDPFAMAPAEFSADGRLAAAPVQRVPTLADVTSLFGHLDVDTGLLPYAEAYGHSKGARKMPLADFATKYMGTGLGSRGEGEGEGGTVLLAHGVDAGGATAGGATAGMDHPDADAVARTLQAAGHPDSPAARAAAAIVDGSAYGGPESGLDPPPYIFDGRVLRGDGASLVEGFSFPSQFRKDDADRQLAMGPPRSGAMMHFHSMAVNLLFVGVKLWVFTPPTNASFVDAHAVKFWRDFYLPAHGPTHGQAGGWGGGGGLGGHHYLVLQGPGDLIHVPMHWGHAVLNLADTFALAYE
jgi:hypothetical protein